MIEYMTSQLLKPLAELDGFLAAAIVDATSGSVLELIGDYPDLEAIAAGNAGVIGAKLKVMQGLDVEDRLEDILISLKKQYHLLRVLQCNDQLFLFLMLNRSQSNLAMARHMLKKFEQQLDIS